MDHKALFEKIDSLHELIDYADAYMAEPNAPEIEKATAAEMKAEAQRAILAIRMELVENGFFD
jgi:hypothetical protein